MTTQKLSDEELAKLTGLGAGSISSWYCSDFIRHTAASMLIEIIESRIKLAKVEELVAALEPIASRIKSLEEGLGGLAKYANAGTCEIKIQLLRDARLALENWRKS